MLVFLNQLSIFRLLCTPHSGRLLDTAALAAAVPPATMAGNAIFCPETFVLGLNSVKNKINFLLRVIGLVISCSSRSEQTYNFWVFGHYKDQIYNSLLCFCQKPKGSV